MTNVIRGGFKLYFCRRLQTNITTRLLSEVEAPVSNKCLIKNKNYKMKNLGKVLCVILMLNVFSNVLFAQSIEVTDDEILIESGTNAPRSEIQINSQWGSFNYHAEENGNDWFNTIRTFPTRNLTKCYIVNTNNTDQFFVRGDGFVFARGAYLNASDSTLKTDIKALTSGVSLLNQLSPVTYKWKKDKESDLLSNSTHFGKGKQIGLLAQEVKDIVPEAVYTDENGMLAIDYISMIPVLIQGFKEQQTIIDSQNKSIEELKVELQIMKEDLMKIQKKK